MSAPADRFDVPRLGTLISPLRRSLLRAARAAEHLPDIPDAQIEVLRSLPAGTVRSPAEIADELTLSRTTVSNLLGTMEAVGLITREADPHDRRRIAVRASTRALGLLGRFDQASAAMLSQAIAALPRDDRVALGAALPALERLRDEMQAIARTGDVSGRPS